MNWKKGIVIIRTEGKGLYPFTDRIKAKLEQWGVREGICHLYIQHTSASLVISESYDPTAKQDLETFMDKLAPEGESWHRHTLEGKDDSPSHMRAMLTATSLSIPVDNGEMNLGRWQGVYIFEHRASGSRRKVLIRCLEAS
ncbi:MAG: secondary thiamine-phosphate synthase enzyme YjbQ [Anaerolineales bacterium]|nr:secondary thiamine-phosphate synthase enzyme YjbQ [Anaerolineales bacterium]